MHININMKQNIIILLYSSIFYMILQLIMIHNNIDIIINLIGFFTGVILLYSIYINNSYLCHMSHYLFQIYLFLIAIFSFNKYNILLLILLLSLTSFFRSKMKMCPFKELDKEKNIFQKYNLPEIPFRNVILLLNIISIIKLFYIT